MAQKLEILKFYLNYMMIAMFGIASYYFINYDKLNWIETACLGGAFVASVIAAYCLTKMYVGKINE